jgi:hypothetical protein
VDICALGRQMVNYGKPPGITANKQAFIWKRTVRLWFAWNIPASEIGPGSPQHAIDPSEKRRKPDASASTWARTVSTRPSSQPEESGEPSVRQGLIRRRVSLSGARYVPKCAARSALPSS